MKRLILAALLAAPSVASAHIMPEGQGSTRIVGKNAYTLLSIPAKALVAFDDDHDGLLSRAELARHGTAIDSMLKSRVRLYSGSVAGRIAWQTLSIEHSDTPDAPMSSVTLVRVSEWELPPTRLRVASDLGSQVEFRAILGERTETDTLSARRSEVEFFTPRNSLRASDLALAFGALALIPLAIVAKKRARRPADAATPRFRQPSIL